MTAPDTPDPEAGELAAAERLLDDGRPAEAMMQAQLALARRPDDAEAAALQQRILAAIAATDPALARLELTAALHADRPEPHYQLGHAYLELERPQDASRSFRRALALAPGSADVQAALASAHLRQHQAGEAAQCARLALGLDPGHAVASQVLASVLEARGDEPGARALLDAAYRRQSLFREPAPEGGLNVLVLATAGAGNVPHARIMPPRRYGRLLWYMDYALEADTPAADRYDVVFNAIGDADWAGASSQAVARFLAGCPRPVLNRPEKVERTRRDRLSALLDGLPDVVVPRTERLRPGDAPDALARRGGLEPPLLLRPAGSHGGQGMMLAEDAAALAGYPLAPDGDHYLTRFVDYRSADGLYRKYRILFVDRRPFPYHLAISDHWLVHHDTAGMAQSRERQAEEARFLQDPQAAIGPRAMAGAAAIGQALDLDYAGVDFSVLPDGRLLVFEANATMLAHDEDPAGPFAYKNPYVEAVAAAFQAHLAWVATAGN